jgi:hypothetical protein
MIKLAIRYDPLLVFLTPLLLVVGAVLKVIVGIEAVGEPYWERAAFVHSWNITLNYSLCVVLAIGVALMMNQLVQYLGIMGRITNLTMLVFAMLFFSVPDAVHAWIAWPIVMLLLLAFRWLEDMYDKPAEASSLVFNASFIIGMLSLLVEGVSIMLFLVVHAMLLSSTTSFRRLLIMVLGFATPLYFFNAVLYVQGLPFVWPLFSWEFELLNASLSSSDALGIAFLGYMALITGVSLAAGTSSVTLRERRRWLLVVGFLACGGWVILMHGYTEGVFVAIVPASMVLAKALLGVKNQKVANVLLLIFLAFVFLINS